MKRILFSLLVLWCFSAAGFDVSPSVVVADSLLTKNKVYELTFTYPDSALNIVTVMRNRKLLPAFRLDMIEGDVYFNNGRYRQAEIAYLRAFRSDSVQQRDDEYMDMLHRMISLTDCMNRVDEKQKYVELLLAKADEAGDVPMQSIARFNLGKIIYYQGDVEQGYRYMHEAVAMMENAEYSYKYDNLRYDYNTLLVLQERDGRWDEALQSLEALSRVVQADDEGLHIDGLADKELKNYYAHKTIITSRQGKKKEAEYWYGQWNEFRSVYERDNYIIMPYLFSNKRYDEIIALNEERENHLKEGKDTISYHMRSVKRMLARAYSLQGKDKLAARYFEELARLTDSLKTREQKSDALEFAAIYAAQEKDAQLQEQKAMVSRRNLFLGASLLILLLLLVILWLNHRNMIRVREKNRTIMQRIRHMQRQKDEFMRIISNKEQEGVVGKEQEPVSRISGDTLFIKLTRLMDEEKMFLNAGLTRDEVVAALNTNKNMLLSVLKKNTGFGFADYINNLRLEESISLLDRQDETVNVEDVAERVGLSKSSFYRLFKEKYGMTPNEYRQLAKKNS